MRPYGKPQSNCRGGRRGGAAYATVIFRGLVSSRLFSVIFSTPSARLFELKPLRNPMQHELVEEPFGHLNGYVYPPTAPGLGISVIEEVVDRYRSEKVLEDPAAVGARIW